MHPLKNFGLDPCRPQTLQGSIDMTRRHNAGISHHQNLGHPQVRHATRKLRQLARPNNELRARTCFEIIHKSAK